MAPPGKGQQPPAPASLTEGLPPGFCTLLHCLAAEHRSLEARCRQLHAENAEFRKRSGMEEVPFDKRCDGKYAAADMPISWPPSLQLKPAAPPKSVEPAIAPDEVPVADAPQLLPKIPVSLPFEDQDRGRGLSVALPEYAHPTRGLSVGLPEYTHPAERPVPEDPGVDAEAHAPAKTWKKGFANYFTTPSLKAGGSQEILWCLKRDESRSFPDHVLQQNPPEDTQDPNEDTGHGSMEVHTGLAKSSTLMDDTLSDARNAMRGEPLDSDDVVRNTLTSWGRLSLRGFIRSGVFEAIFGCVIIINTVVIAVEMQYESFDLGVGMSFPGYLRNGSQEWPGALLAFKCLEYVFGFMYTSEIVLKAYALGCNYFRVPWHGLDCAIVGMFYVEVLGEALGLLVGGSVNLVILRLVRFAKVLRLIKLVRNVRMLDPLTLMISSLSACAPVLLWSMLLLFSVHLLTSLFVYSTLRDFMGDSSVEASRREVAFQYFGSFTRAQVSMFELTMGNWVPITRGLAENVDELWGMFFVTYKIFVGFAVVKVMTGIFLHETFKCAATDDHIMILTKQRAYRQHVRKMTKLLKDADTGGDGKMDKAEFNAILTNADIKMWLAAQEIEVRDPDAIFKLLDNGDGIVERAELVARFAHMKGPARSIDLLLTADSIKELGHICIANARRTEALEVLLRRALMANQICPPRL